jgi:hypothetical protein
MLSSDLSRHVDKYYGKYAGFVAEKVESDVHGAIMVEIPGFTQAGVPVRARPCLPYAHFYMPHAGTRVWIEFEGGHTDYPLWVGVWYPENTAPEEARAKPDFHRVIQTPAGHTVELSDEEGAEKIVVRHKDNSFVALQPDGSVLVSNTKGAYLFLNADNGQTTLTSQHGHLVSLTKDAAMLVNDQGTSIELKGKTATILADNIVGAGKNIALGAGATDPTIMGNAFKLMWTLLQTHVHPTAMGPTLPPTPPLPPLVDGIHLSSSVVVK